MQSRLLAPTSLDELFLFRLTRLLAVAGAPVIRLCEGQHNITRREWRLIAALAQQGPMLSSELADYIHLDRGRTSKAVSDLVEKRLLLRSPRPGDRRRVDLALNDAGQSVYDSLFPAVVTLNQTLLAELSVAELDGLDHLLTKLQKRAETYLSSVELPKANRQLGRHRS